MKNIINYLYQIRNDVGISIYGNIIKHRQAFNVFHNNDHKLFRLILIEEAIRNLIQNEKHWIY